MWSYAVGVSPKKADTGPSAPGAIWFRERPPTRVRGSLDRDGIASVVDYLVCVAGLTEFDPVVVENGLALFADRVHGPAATARLAALAQGTGWEANAARTFRTQVRGYLRGPGR